MKRLDVGIMLARKIFLDESGYFDCLACFQKVGNTLICLACTLACALQAKGVYSGYAARLMQVDM